MPARLRLNLFSPLPPQRSEIGNHTLVVAEVLRELADVTLWTDQAEHPLLERYGGASLKLPVMRFGLPWVDWRALHHADAQIYNIGNNGPVHGGIFDIATQAPGLMVMHDTRLQHFFAYSAVGGGADQQLYLARLRRAEGSAAFAAAQRWLAGQLRFETLVENYPMTTAATSVALAAIVHNRAEQRRVAEASRTPVFYLPLAHAAESSPPHLGGRAQPRDTLRLVVFGYLGQNRRVPALLDALASLPDQNLRLDIYGVVEDAAEIGAKVVALGLGGRVHQHGFVANETLQAALADADLAVNLRNPTVGEASASQLRIWEAALPALVTRTGWYATLPDDTVFFVDPDHEADDLRMHLEALRRNPERFRQAGLRGRAMLAAEHTPERYARGLLDVAAQVPALHARRTALDLSRRAARTMLDLAGPQSIALCASEAVAAAAALAGEMEGGPAA